MVRENMFNKEADEANLRLNDRMDNESDRPYSANSGKNDSITETNLKIQDAFYNDSHDQNDVPTYVTNETAAIKINTEKNKI